MYRPQVILPWHTNESVRVYMDKDGRYPPRYHRPIRIKSKSGKWKGVSGNSKRHVRPEASRSHRQRPTQTTPQSLWVCAMQIHPRDIYSHQLQDILHPLR